MALATDQPLEAKYRGHDLSGDWAGYRECHVKPDLLLIYRKPDADTLRLARLGSAGIPVSIAHTENEHEIRIISFRKATPRETQIYFDEIKN